MRKQEPGGGSMFTESRPANHAVLFFFSRSFSLCLTHTHTQEERMIWYVGQYPFWSSSRWDVPCCFAVTLISEELQEDRAQSATDPWERLHLHTGERPPALWFCGADPCNGPFVRACVCARCSSHCDVAEEEEEEEEKSSGGAAVMQRVKPLTGTV